MEPFLLQIAKYYQEVAHLERYCFVFSNRRSKVYFENHLRACQKGSGAKLMPQILTSDEWVEMVAPIVGEPRAKTTDIDALAMLYEAYKALPNKKKEYSFDEFVGWGLVTLRDFDLICRERVDAMKLYQNIAEYDAIRTDYFDDDLKKTIKRIFGIELPQSDSERTWMQGTVVEDYKTLIELMPALYEEFERRMREKGMITAGEQLLRVAEGLEECDLSALPFEKCVFVGMVNINRCNTDIFKALRQKADFWWDKPALKSSEVNKGIALIEEYSRRFPSPQEIEVEEGHAPEVEVIALPGNVAQVKGLCMRFAEQQKAFREPAYAMRTAVVLPEEKLLVPLVNSFPEGIDVNITMGYPMRYSLVISLMRVVLKAHARASRSGDRWMFYREDAKNLLSHPIVKTCYADDAARVLKEISDSRDFNVAQELFADTALEPLMTIVNDPAKYGEFIDNLWTFCEQLYHRLAPQTPTSQEDVEDSDAELLAMPLQAAFTRFYMETLQQIKRVLSDYAIEVQPDTLLRLIDRLGSSQVIAFSGEPVKGVQVMGAIETRNLDFDRVIVLSANEGVYPRRERTGSFISNMFRHAYGIQTAEQLEAVTTYDFYRLIARAKQLTLLYNAASQNGSSEPSRFVEQLQSVYGCPEKRTELAVTPGVSEPVDISVPNDASTEQKYTKGEARLSASSINEYIDCPLCFYLHHIKGLRIDDPDDDFMGYDVFGTIVHNSLNDLYKDRKSVSAADIDNYKKTQLSGVIKRNINSEYLHLDRKGLSLDTELQGEAAIMKETFETYVKRALDYDKSLLAGGKSLTIVECEEPHNVKLEVGGVTFDFTYRPDRIDRLPDGTLRIVDYKTGKDETSFYDFEQLFKPAAGRRHAILQLLLYCHAYQTEHPEEKKITPVIYKLSQMKETGVKYGQRDAKKQYEWTGNSPEDQEFLNRMFETINALFHHPFTQNTDKQENACRYCKYIDICRRVSKNNEF